MQKEGHIGGAFQMWNAFFVSKRGEEKASMIYCLLYLESGFTGNQKEFGCFA